MTIDFRSAPAPDGLSALPGSPAPVPALVLRSVGKVLGGKQVVHGLDLEVAPGELLCILGPSGCGKTTTLRMVAGFLSPDHGQVLIDGRDVTDLGARHRPTAMVFQNYALWPHMSVLRNITFGLCARGMARAAANERARQALALVGLEGHAYRLPGALSGGEQQRVALARAMVLEPTLLLMDEPLSNLDAQLRLRVREELVELQQRTGVTMIFVTHDQDEALSIAHRVAVMNEGRLDQVDPPTTLYRDPATSFVAGFVGRVNIMAGTINQGRLDLVFGTGGALLPATAGRAVEPAGALEGAVEVAVRPEEVGLDVGAVSQADRGVFEGEVQRVLSRGHFDEVLVMTSLGLIRAYVVAGTAPVGRTGVSFGRMLLYQAGRLVGTATGAASRRFSAPPTPPDQSDQPGPPGQTNGYVR
jgi:putative spermidine/putrescine transport system ATP-binding protein